MANNFSGGWRVFSEKDSGGWWVNDKGSSGEWSLFFNVKQLEKTSSKYYLSMQCNALAMQSVENKATISNYR